MTPPQVILALSLLVLFQCCTEYSGKFETKLPTSAISIEYLAHACFIISDSDTRIMLDPYADRIWLGYDFPKNIIVDAVFITHPHYDHDGGIFRGKRPYWFLNTSFYQSPNEYEIGKFRVKGLIGKHADPYGKEFGHMNTIWKIYINDIVLAHLGDNGPLSEENIEALADVDILLIPMDGDYHIISLEDYKNTFMSLEPSIIIPMHYRIPELEAEINAPKNLGEIDPFLKQRPSITRNDSTSYLPVIKYLDANKLILSATDLPDSSQYYVFKHSPLVRKASTQH